MDTGDKVFLGLVGLIFLALAALITIPSGQVDFCYIDSYHNGEQRVFMTKGHRAYRPDRDLYRGQNLDDAVEAAKKLDCTLK